MCVIERVSIYRHAGYFGFAKRGDEIMCANDDENATASRLRQRVSRKPVGPPDRLFGVWYLFIGFVSLIWFLLRVATKPSRIHYPCQRVAAPLASGFILYVAGTLSSLVIYKKYRLLIRKMSRRAALACLCLGVVAFVTLLGTRVSRVLGISDPVHQHSPIGVGNPRVVSVHDDAVSNWTGQQDYWNYVSQTVVDSMMNQAVLAMTGTSTIGAAWNDILPDYSSGKTIAIKVNYNNGGAWGALRLNSLPQPVIALLKQLTQFGFSESEIFVYDTSRPISGSPGSIHYFFRNQLETQFPGVNIVDLSTAGRWSSNTFCTYSTIDGTVCTRYAALLEEVDYLINVPIMRAHGYSGVTFGFKNHYGSIETINFGGGVEPLHDGIRQSHDGYSATGVPLVELNSLPPIRDKTVLVVGDGIYSNTVANTEPPNISPEVIFMSKDPVALDSVMFDYFHTLSTRQIWHQNYLHLAAQAGLGVHEHYPYSQIDYVEMEGSANIPPNAVAAADPVSGTAPLLVDFDGSGSSDPDGTIENWYWSFGDSGTGSGATTSHLYTSADTYVATLTVTDNDGATDVDTVTITVGPPGDSDGDGLNDDDETRDLDPGTPGTQNPFNPDDPDSTGDNGAVGPDGIPDGANDWDGDGMNNKDEFLFGYNPIDPDSLADVPLFTAFNVWGFAVLLTTAALRRMRYLKS